MCYFNPRQDCPPSSRADESTSTTVAPEDNASAPEGPPFLYCLNIVRTKHDSTARRGALVKALAICSSYHFLQVHMSHKCERTATPSSPDLSSPRVLSGDKSESHPFTIPSPLSARRCSGRRWSWRWTCTSRRAARRTGWRSSAGCTTASMPWT